MPAPAALFASLLFSLIGMVSFMYGKRTLNWAHMGIGAGLMGYTWFVSDTFWLYAIGGVLCFGIYWFRE